LPGKSAGYGLVSVWIVVFVGEEGLFLIEDGCFRNGNCGFRVEVGWFWGLTGWFFGVEKVVFEWRWVVMGFEGVDFGV